MATKPAVDVNARGPVSRKAIRNEILACIRDAHTTYRHISGGLWPDETAEPYLGVKIAERIAKKAGVSVTLETPTQEVIDGAKKDGRGRPLKDFRHGRVDIVVWWKRETVRHVIEVKKILNGPNFKKDVGRIEDLLRLTNTSIRAGFLAATAAKESRDALETQHDRAFEYVVNAAPKLSVESFKGKVTKTDGWFRGISA